MKYCIIEVQSQTATFRNPEFQNFHKTLSLPPPTTMIGLAGAAMGLDPKSAQDFFSEVPFQFGVYGKSGGTAKDLWKYDDFKNRSIILKEMLINNEFFLVYGTDDEQRINLLIRGFINPVYALTLGNSDGLAKINPTIRTVNVLTESRVLEYCLVDGDIIKEVLATASVDPAFSIYTTSEPIALDIATHFRYDEAYGMRSVIRRKTLSFVNKRMELNMAKQGIIHKDRFIPVFDYQN
jgi:CRISPR-associated protein Cas5t